LQHKASAKERIVASAKQLFAEQGFHRTAMADLADYAQVSVGTIYRSFASKSDIIRAIIQADTEETLGRLQQDIDQVRDGSVTGAVAIERMIFEWVSKRTDALSHEIVAEGHRNPELAEMLSSVCGQYRDLFRTLAELLGPKLGEAEIEGVAELLLACLFGMGNREFTHPRLDEAQTATIVTKLILQCQAKCPEG
jgi:TetR/AcrR family transcriptional regulator, repressor for uid operon